MLEQAPKTVDLTQYVVEAKPKNGQKSPKSNGHASPVPKALASTPSPFEVAVSEISPAPPVVDTLELAPADIDVQLPTDPTEIKALEEEAEEASRSTYIPSNDELRTPEALTAYLADIRKGRLLTPAEELSLGKNVQAAKAIDPDFVARPTGMTDYTPDQEKVIQEGLRARQRLIEMNLRLVINVAKKYIGKGLPLEDLIQGGNEGLIEAVEKFDSTRGFRFSTMAYWWIRKGVTETLSQQSRTIRMPQQTIGLLTNIGYARRELSHLLGRNPTDEEIAQEMAIPLAEIADIIRASRQPISIHRSIGTNPDVTLEQVIPAEKSDLDEAVEIIANNGMKQDFDPLTPKEATTLSYLYGVETGSPMNLQEVADKLEISRQRVQQLEAAALRKLRQNDNWIERAKARGITIPAPDSFVPPPRRGSPLKRRVS